MSEKTKHRRSERVGHRGTRFSPLLQQLVKGWQGRHRRLSPQTSTVIGTPADRLSIGIRWSATTSAVLTSWMNRVHLISG
jgi:hypothetical protein